MKVILLLLSLLGFAVGGLILWSALKTAISIIYISQHSLAFNNITNILGNIISISLRILLTLFVIFPWCYRFFQESLAD